MKSNQTQEIEFIFSLMRELLEEVAPEIREIFIALKEDKTADTGRRGQDKRNKRMVR